MDFLCASAKMHNISIVGAIVEPQMTTSSVSEPTTSPVSYIRPKTAPRPQTRPLKNLSGIPTALRRLSILHLHVRKAQATASQLEGSSCTGCRRRAIVDGSGGTLACRWRRPQRMRRSDLCVRPTWPITSTVIPAL
ncbi:hypothetical protein FIBSPDRAFT_325852 [Athelia psychrophila]|uniref:Uncharacterized protein n=1 Tax=Athelia psychrophila TaxID=1759441 RepID=A0A166Q925_9AGAM|nr:hypothetical protein FIBSPDRAFT_325852 [Fibularhizoctonia sp. CBS 109695]